MIKSEEKTPVTTKQSLTLTMEEVSKLAEFYTLLAQIDKRQNLTKTYAKPAN
ncbi:MAG: hypothetical protein NT141_02685 [candidate division WWE3 bacterium]|nr:hypothetical protein [candidate division WWE3 bacterium]